MVFRRIWKSRLVWFRYARWFLYVAISYWLIRYLIVSLIPLAQSMVSKYPAIHSVLHWIIGASPDMTPMLLGLAGLSYAFPEIEHRIRSSIKLRIAVLVVALLGCVFTIAANQRTRDKQDHWQGVMLNLVQDEPQVVMKLLKDHPEVFADLFGSQAAITKPTKLSNFLFMRFPGLRQTSPTNPFPPTSRTDVPPSPVNRPTVEPMVDLTRMTSAQLDSRASTIYQDCKRLLDSEEVKLKDADHAYPAGSQQRSAVGQIVVNELATPPISTCVGGLAAIYSEIRDRPTGIQLAGMAPGKGVMQEADQGVGHRELVHAQAVAQDYVRFTQYWAGRNP